MSGTTTHEHPAAGAAARSRIVVGLADDDPSWDALRWALARAARDGGAVHAVRAIRADDRDGISSGCSGGTDRAVVETETGALRRLAAQVALGVGATRVPSVSLSWCPGRAPEVLMAAAREADALVVGAPGGSGRTSRALFVGARCPVTTVGRAAGVRSGRPYRHVVVGVDASATGPAREAVAGVVREALHHARAGDRVTVVAGFRPEPVRRDWPRGYRPSPTVDEQVSAVREATSAVVGPAVEHLRREGADRGVSVDVLGWPQDPRRAVLGAARDLGADELVLPRGGTWSARELLRLARVAPCAVTAVPDPGRVRTMITPPRSGPVRAGAAASRAAAR